ncbi:hypothetical protein [Sphingobium scionense]|uniref:Uncharacterized protein n=1 Tax=Sphingobium scionense TaxID=1404341 RepID=A0A7W6PZ69_9SPHN|nr:hypothetical protein [Sphingobium scionense]MBB4151017.1 hypothetical protein [Sphingobium scionense]
MAKPPDAKQVVIALPFVRTAGLRELGKEIFPFKRVYEKNWHSMHPGANAALIRGLEKKFPLDSTQGRTKILDRVGRSPRLRKGATKGKELGHVAAIFPFPASL